MWKPRQNKYLIRLWEKMSNKRMIKTQGDDDGAHLVWAMSLGPLPMGVASSIMM